MSTFTVHLIINTEAAKTIWDLAPGDLYITVAAFRREGIGSNALNNIRRRTKDPYKSETFYGSSVRAYPSDKVFVVEDTTPNT